MWATPLANTMSIQPANASTTPSTPGVASSARVSDRQDAVGAACGHTFCRACAVEYTGASVGPARCPACHKALTIDLAVAAPVRSKGAVREARLRQKAF